MKPRTLSYYKSDNFELALENDKGFGIVTTK